MGARQEREDTPNLQNALNIFLYQQEVLLSWETENDDFCHIQFI